MPVVEPLEEEQIEDELREYVQFFKGPLGVVPNSVRTMSRRPHIARAFTDLNIAVMTRWDRRSKTCRSRLARST